MNFETVANQYLQELETGSNPCRRSTLNSYRSILRTHLAPRYGSAELSELARQNNCVLRQLVKELRSNYAAASIQLIVLTFRSVLEFPRDSNGVPTYTLRWEPTFYDAPAIANQKQPTVTPEQVRDVVQEGPDATLYALLAASGLRISEAQALVKDDVSDGAVHVRQGKTVNAARFVDLAPLIAETMARLASETTSGARLFPASLTTLRQRIRVPGFHSLRRFRESVLQRSECRNLLINAWMGHRDPEMSSRYGKQLLEDVAFRRSWAEKVGTGW